MAHVSEGEIIRRLISLPAASQDPVAVAQASGIAIFADYEGHRTRATYYETGRVVIADGPLQGRSFKSPTGAARAVVRQYNPTVNDNRNGWRFWRVDGHGRERAWLQEIRPAQSRTAEASHRLTRAFKNAGLRVVFVLLCNAELPIPTHREIAENCGTSLGTVQAVLSELNDGGYVAPRKGGRLRRSRELFTRWVGAYATELYPSLQIAVFDALDPAWWRTSVEEVQAAGGQWGAEVAAHLLGSRLVPARATIYAPKVPTELAIRRRFQRASGSGNVEIRERFWSLPNRSDAVTVPTLLTYADLLAIDDPRTREAAAFLRENDEDLRRIDES